MGMILANGKKAKLLEQERPYLNTLEYRLFKNNYVPLANMVIGDFTEVTDGGYAPLTVIGFAAAILNGANQSELAAPAWTTTFNFSGGGFTVYGYFVRDPADNTVVYAERDPSPFVVDAAGRTYTVYPKKLQDTM